MSSPTANISIRPTQFDDYPQIAALESRNQLQAKSRPEWEYLWLGNPVFLRLNQWPMGWVAENSQGEIIASIGNVPVSYHFQDREAIAGTVRSVVVDTPYRGKGHGASLCRAFLHQQDADLVVISTANANSFKLFEAVGFTRVPAGEWNRTQFWITNYRGFLASALRSKNFPVVLSYPAAAVLAFRDRITRVHAWVQENRYEVSYCSGFDERFEVFWEELKRTYPGRLLATRSREVLQWHFKYALAEKRVWILTAGDDTRIFAYAIFLRQDNRRLGLKRVRLIDFQVLQEAETKLLVPMLSWATLRCRDEGVHMLEAYGFSGQKRLVIDDLAPYDRYLRLWPYYYGSRNSELAKQLKNPAVWDPSHFEGDATL